MNSHSKELLLEKKPKNRIGKMENFKRNLKNLSFYRSSHCFSTSFVRSIEVLKKDSNIQCKMKKKSAR